MKYFICILLLILSVNSLCAEKEGEFIKITTIKEILKNMVEKYEKIKTYRSDFYIKSKIDKIESWSKGQIKYRTLCHSIKEVVCLRIKYDRFSYPVGPKIIVGYPSQAGFNAT